MISSPIFPEFNLSVFPLDCACAIPAAVAPLEAVVGAVAGTAAAAFAVVGFVAAEAAADDSKGPPVAAAADQQEV